MPSERSPSTPPQWWPSASAGSLDALTAVLAPLPASFPAAVVIVRHVTPGHQSDLADILGRRTALKVREAEEGDVLLPASPTSAPPDRHLLVKPGGVLSLSSGPKVQFARPSAEPLSVPWWPSTGACRRGGPDRRGRGRLGGVVLVKEAGGTVIAQDEASSADFGMPGAAINTGRVDMVLALDDIAPVLAGLAGRWGGTAGREASWNQPLASWSRTTSGTPASILLESWPAWGTRPSRRRPAAGWSRCAARPSRTSSSPT